jgi:hypothetical protein
MKNYKTLNQIFYGSGAKSKEVCTNCGKITSIIKSQHASHIWKYWGYCDHCNTQQIEYKNGGTNWQYYL